MLGHVRTGPIRIGGVGFGRSDERVAHGGRVLRWHGRVCQAIFPICRINIPRGWQLRRSRGEVCPGSKAAGQAPRASGQARRTQHSPPDLGPLRGSGSQREEGEFAHLPLSLAPMGTVRSVPTDDSAASVAKDRRSRMQQFTVKPMTGGTKRRASSKRRPNQRPGGAS